MDSKSKDKGAAKSFEDLARELECDEDEAAFEEAVKKIVQAPKLPADDAAAKAGEARLPRNWRDD